MVCQAARAGPRAEEAAGGWEGKGSPRGSWLALGTAPWQLPQRDLVCQTLKPRKRPVTPPRLGWLFRAVGFTETGEPGARANFWNQTDWVEFWNGHLLFNCRLLYKSPSAPCLSTSISAGARGFNGEHTGSKAADLMSGGIQSTNGCPVTVNLQQMTGQRGQQSLCC